MGIKNINDSIKGISAPDGRMDMVLYKNNSIIIDYAHTPDAISKILDTVKKICVGNIYVVFGCTGSRDRTKRPIMTKLVLSNVTKAIITIDDPHDEDINQIFDDMLKNNTYTNYIVEPDRGRAIEEGIKLLNNNDMLLVLEKGHEEVIIYGKERIPFNDKKKVLEVINKES